MKTKDANATVEITASLAVLFAAGVGMGARMIIEPVLTRDIMPRHRLITPNSQQARQSAFSQQRVQTAGSRLRARHEMPGAHAGSQVVGAGCRHCRWPAVDDGISSVGGQARQRLLR